MTTQLPINPGFWQPTKNQMRENAELEARRAVAQIEGRDGETMRRMLGGMAKMLAAARKEPDFTPEYWEYRLAAEILQDAATNWVCSFLDGDPRNPAQIDADEQDADYAATIAAI